MNVSKRMKGTLFTFVSFYLFILGGFLLVASISGIWDQILWNRVWFVPAIPSLAVGALFYNVIKE